MSVLPNSFMANSSSTNLITSVAQFSTPNAKQQLTDNSRSLIIKCAVCEEILVQTNNNDQKAITYRMLAVRPSIGSGSKDPFFPILETLTHTSAVHVPCCLACSQSLLEQWNEYEAKNVLIKNRVYKLPQLNRQNQLHNRLSKTMMVVDNSALNHQKTLLLSSNSCSNNSVISLTATNPTATRIQLAHPISLSNNGNFVVMNNNNSGQLSGTTDSNSSTTTPSPQDEVLDLSMTTGMSLSNNNLSNAAIPTATPTLNLITANKITTPVALVNTATSASSHRTRNAPISRSDSANSSIIAISPYSMMNSSMTNLIKVSANPVVLKPLQLSASNNNNNNNNETNTQNNSPSSAKRLLLSCALCDESCPTLYSIMLRPMGNCPYFPTLTSYVKMNSIDSTGKISVCESCHHQLIVQWDQHQKSNKPISERQYQLTRIISSKLQQNHSIGPETVLNTNSNNNRNNYHVPPISQSFVSLVAANKTFICVMCGKDLISQASSSNNTSNGNNNSSSASSSPVAFSVLTENDTSGNVITKKLIVQSAQEINLLPFLSNSSTSLHLHQLQLLQDSGRLLICSGCFESINSRYNNSNSLTSNSSNGSENNSGSNISLIDSNSQNSIINRSMHNDSSLNGTITGLNSVSNDDSKSLGLSNLLCLACNQHKSQYLVETKENLSKKPFFPFLHDSQEPNGRARLCAPCHLMLETQWDAYENSYVPYNQRMYRLPSSTNSQSTIITTKRPPPLVPSSSSGLQTSVNGQATPSPLKIHITVPSSSQPVVAGRATTSDHLLLTTVNQQPQTPNDHNKNDQKILKLMADFLTNLGGPHPILSGTCAICSQHSPVGQTFQIFATPRNITISHELGIYPYFPVLKQLSNPNSKKNSKNSLESPYIACTYCYHSLIAQWTAYHVSSKPEDRDLSARHYNFRDFVCYVCGVTTYRQFVRSIAVKDFPFLIEHKRPPGSLSLNKGESVVTCLTCYQTLTHQWIENERMKVPLEMRKYNWMAVPPPPPPTSSSSTTATTIIKNEPNEPKRPSMNERTIIPILANTASLSYHLNPNTINHNGIIPISTVVSSVPTTVAEIIPKAIIVNASSATSNHVAHNHIVESSGPLKTSPNQITNVVAPTFNPSHTLAPLVAAAMAATPVTIKQETNQSQSDPVIVTNNKNVHNTVNTQITAQPVNANANNATSSFADVLRQLARQQHITIHKMNDPQLSHNLTAEPNGSNPRASSSINLTTLASVAALAGGNRSQFGPTSHSIITDCGSKQPEHSELPKASIINSNSFAIHFNALSNNNINSKTSNAKTFTNHNKVDQDHQQPPNSLKKNMTTVLNNTQNNNISNSNQNNDNHDFQRAAQIMGLDELMNNDGNYDNNFSKVNLEVMRLRKKRIAHLNKLKENLFKSSTGTDQNDSSDLSDAELTEIDDNHSNSSLFNPIIFNDNNYRDSLVSFMDEVLPVLSNFDEDSKDSRKLAFVSLLDLTTQRQKRERKVENFIQNKLYRRLSNASFKVDMFEEEDDILVIDPEYETFKSLAYFIPSDIVPENVKLFEKTENKPKLFCGREKNKDRLMEALNLMPSSIDQKLKNEIDWISVLRNRQMRRKRNIICIGKSFNNLRDELLNEWISDLSMSSTLGPKLKHFNNQFNPIDSNELFKIDEAIKENDIDPETRDDSDEQLTKIINHKSDKGETCQQNNCEDHLNGVSPLNTTNDNQIISPVNNFLPNNQHHKTLINPKQFAQEFHESVLLETQKQWISKHSNNANPGTSLININHCTSPDGAIMNLTNNNAHTIIYTENLKPNQFVIDGHNNQQLLDRNGGIILAATPAMITSIKGQDRNNLRDHISKLQLRIQNLNRECQLLNEKKNEIITNIQKLENEKTFCQMEVDRLTKSLAM